MLKSFLNKEASNLRTYAALSANLAGSVGAATSSALMSSFMFSGVTVSYGTFCSSYLILYSGCTVAAAWPAAFLGVLCVQTLSSVSGISDELPPRWKMKNSRMFSLMLKTNLAVCVVPLLAVSVMMYM
jgi:hypothetical protein